MNRICLLRKFEFGFLFPDNACKTVLQIGKTEGTMVLVKNYRNGDR